MFPVQPLVMDSQQACNATQVDNPTRNKPPITQSLRVDFTWRKFRGYISDVHDSSGQPLYIMKCKSLKSLLLFRDATDTSTWAIGELPIFHIDANCQIRGKSIDIKASKRFQTRYMHLSNAYTSKTGQQAAMTWKSDSDWKTWDFICCNEQDEPVAVFAANWWSLHKVGQIDFLGETTEGMREEIVATGLTLFYTMMVRTTSILSFFGAIFAKPGPVMADEPQKMLVDNSDRTSDEEDGLKTSTKSAHEIKKTP